MSSTSSLLAAGSAVGSAETTPNSSSSRAGVPSSDRGGSSRRKPAERPHRHHPTHHHSGAVKLEQIDSAFNSQTTANISQGLINHSLALGVEGECEYGLIKIENFQVETNWLPRSPAPVVVSE